VGIRSKARAREYPNLPTKPAYAGALFANAAVQLGYTPFQMPSANMTRPYTNFEGVSMQACTVCGFCERFGCEHFAKASPQTTILPKTLSYPNVELRTRAHVTKVLLDSERKRATAILYWAGRASCRRTAPPPTRSSPTRRPTTRPARSWARTRRRAS
jgi:gluconate 2-dehydrogenase alpha chain